MLRRAGFPGHPVATSNPDLQGRLIPRILSPYKSQDGVMGKNTGTGARLPQVLIPSSNIY